MASGLAADGSSLSADTLGELRPSGGTWRFGAEADVLSSRSRARATTTLVGTSAMTNNHHTAVRVPEQPISRPPMAGPAAHMSRDVNWSMLARRAVIPFGTFSLIYVSSSIFPIAPAKPKIAITIAMH
jgi:hypothetical protein